MSEAALHKTPRQKLLTCFVSLISRQTGKIQPVVLPLVWFEEVRLPRVAPGALGRRVWDSRQQPVWALEAGGCLWRVGGGLVAGMWDVEQSQAKHPLSVVRLPDGIT